MRELIPDEWLEIIQKHGLSTRGFTQQARDWATRDGHTVGSNSWWLTMREYRWMLVEELIEPYL